MPPKRLVMAFGLELRRSVHPFLSSDASRFLGVMSSQSGSRQDQSGGRSGKTFMPISSFSKWSPR